MEKLAQLTAHPVAGYTLRDGIIRHKGRIWLACNPELQNRITAAMHASATGGHSWISSNIQAHNKLIFMASHETVHSSICSRM